MTQRKSRAKQIGQEIVDLLNAQTHFDLEIRAEFKWRHMYEPEDDRLHVSVVPSSVQRIVATSALDITIRHYTFTIVIQKRLTNTQSEPDENEVDELVYLAQQIWELVEPSTAADDPDPPIPEDERNQYDFAEADYAATEHEANDILDPEMLDTNIFLHAITITMEDSR